MRDNEFTRILDWPGYRVFRHEIDETAKTLRLWVRRKRGNRKLICSGCGRKFTEAHDSYQREVRDLPWRKYQTTLIIELYRVCCPECGARIEKVPQLPSKAPFSRDFEDGGVGVRWQRLVPFQKLAYMLLDHLDGILNYCRTKVRFGVVEAINGNIKTLLRRGRGYKNLGYLLLKAQRMAVTKTEFIVLQKAA
jgi:transposase